MVDVELLQLASVGVGDADHARAGADFVAEVETGLGWIAGAVGVESGLVEADVVALEQVAGPEVPIFGQRKTKPEAAAGADLLVGRVAVVPDVVEAAVIAVEQL